MKNANSKTLYIVPLAEAEKDIKSYKKMMTDKLKVHQKNVLKAFTIDAQELMDILGISGSTPAFPQIRVYLGKSNGDEAYDMKLFMTPVNSQGKDVILTGNSEGKTLTESDPYVYDFIAPCPNSCDPDSPLYNA